MTTTTSRLGLVRPGTGDAFDTQQHYDNLTKLDGYPGIYPCTSGTRPASWGVNHIGMRIWETDTDLLWRWNGTVFLRCEVKGLLGTTDLTSNFGTSSTSPQTAISCTVTVPATNAGSTAKRIRIAASFSALDNGAAGSGGVSEVGLFRGSTALFVAQWKGRPAAATYDYWGSGGTIEIFDNPSAGSVQYNLKINAVASVGGTSTLRASASYPAQLSVTEVGF